MRAIVATLILLIAAGTASAQGKKIEPLPPPAGQGKKIEPLPPPAGQVKTDFTYFDYWGMTLKSFSLDVVEQQLMDGRIIHFARITYVLEFQYDVPFLQLEPLRRNMGPETKKLRHLFVDHENVALNGGRFLDYKLQGEVSGRGGDAFRVTAEFLDDPRASILNAKKVTVRVPSLDIPTYGR